MTYLTTCCNAIPLEDYTNDPKDHTEPLAIYRCGHCNKECNVDTVESILEAHRVKFKAVMFGDWDNEVIWRKK